MLFLSLVFFSISNNMYLYAISLLFFCQSCQKLYSLTILFTRDGFWPSLNPSCESCESWRNQIVVTFSRKDLEFLFQNPVEAASFIPLTLLNVSLVDSLTIMRPSFCPSCRKYQAPFLHFQPDIAIFPDCKLVSVCTAFQVSVLPHWLIFICPWTFPLFTTVLSKCICCKLSRIKLYSSKKSPQGTFVMLLEMEFPSGTFSKV